MSRRAPTVATAPPRAAKAPPRALAFARFIVAGVDGAAPREARLWQAGWNDTDKGALNFTPESAKMVMQAYADRGNPLAWYYEHENREPLSVRGGCPMKGVCSAPRSVLAIRGPANAPECWAAEIEWTAEATRQITSGERTQLSPVAAFDSETREIVAILDVSLCAEGATHNGTILASRNGKDTGTMDEMIQQILDALQQGDFETAETLVQQMEAQAPDAAMTKMARAAMAKKPPADAPPPPPPAPPVVAKKMAALSRADVPAGVNVEAFNVALGRLDTATGIALAAAKRSDRQTVVAALSRAIERGLPIDVIDEREHVTACDPAATEKWIASLGRKVTAGVLVASKAPAVPAGETKPGAKPGERTAANDFGLTEIQKAAAKQHNVTFEAYAKSVERIGGKPVEVGAA